MLNFFEKLLLAYPINKDVECHDGINLLKIKV